MNKNMEKRELWIVALSESISKPGHYALILEDTLSKRRIPLIIGVGEAQAIAIAMEKMQPSRPQTHDLLHQIIISLNASLTQVVINRLEKEVFYANIILKTPTENLEIDARPSDAIALAVRFGCPIYATTEVIENSAYDFDEKTRDKRGSYAEYTLAELEELLAKIIKKEDYESAVRVRDTIERRKK
jgi:uncharacterized protein